MDKHTKDIVGGANPFARKPVRYRPGGSKSESRTFQFQMTNDYVSTSQERNGGLREKMKGQRSKGGENWGNKRFRKGNEDEEVDSGPDPRDLVFSTASAKMVRNKSDEGTIVTSEINEQRKSKVEQTINQSKSTEQRINGKKNPAYCKPFEYIAPMQNSSSRFGLSRPFKPPVPGENDTTQTQTNSQCNKHSNDEFAGIDQNLVQLIRSQIMSEGLNIGWDEIAGLVTAKKILKEIVVLPFLRPEIFTGIRAPPKGVLLFGPPGTGKTMIGKCVASEARATFFNITASSLTSKWVGEGEKLVRALFAVARKRLPAIIFIDEVDSLLSARCEGEHESSRRIKTEFLVQLDGVCTANDERLLVIGATNRPAEIDEAARRRFSKRLLIALPDKQGRIEVMYIAIKQLKHSLTTKDVDHVAEITEGFSGADVMNLCKEAAMGPIRALTDITTVAVDDIAHVTLHDFTQAMHNVRPSLDTNIIQQYVNWNTQFGSTTKSP